MKYAPFKGIHCSPLPSVSSTSQPDCVERCTSRLKQNKLPNVTVTYFFSHPNPSVRQCIFPQKSETLRPQELGDAIAQKWICYLLLLHVSCVPGPGAYLQSQKLLFYVLGCVCCVRVSYRASLCSRYSGPMSRSGLIETMAMFLFIFSAVILFAFHNLAVVLTGMQFVAPVE